MGKVMNADMKTVPDCPSNPVADEDEDRPTAILKYLKIIP